MNLTADYTGAATDDGWGLYTNTSSASTSYLETLVETETDLLTYPSRGAPYMKLLVGGIKQKIEENIYYKWADTPYKVSNVKSNSTSLTYTWGELYGHATATSDNWAPPPRILTPSERLREIMQARRAPAFVSTRKPIQTTEDIREMRARETLRRVIGDAKFRNFLKTGFVTVRGPSGLTYQIFPGHGITNVFDCGKPVERLCVVLRGNFPPTDSLITRFLMLLNNEDQFRSLAVKFQPRTRTTKAPLVDQRSLAEIFCGLKAAG